MPSPFSRLLPLLLAVLMVGALAAPASATHSPSLAPVAQSEKGDPASAQSLETYRSPAGRHKLLVRSAGAAQRLSASGGALVAEYESFSVFDASTAAADALVASGDAELRDDYNLILLNAGAIDTTTPEAAALQAAPGSFAGKRMWLVQFAGPMRPEWYDDLLKTGVEVVTAIPSNAYLVYGEAGALQALDSLAKRAPAVQWSGPYRDTYRVHPALLSAPTPLLDVQLFADPAANAATLALIGSLRQGQVYQQKILHYVNLVVPADPSAIALIAARPDVVSINPYVVPQMYDESQDQIVAGNVTATGPQAGDYLAQLAAWGFTQAQFTASGFAVDVTDSGVDNATTSPNHFALYVNGVRPGTSRVIYNRLQGTPNGGSTIAGADGHGTLNAHIVGGYVPSGAPYNAFPHADSNGLRYGLGVAPFVRIGSSVIFDPNYTDPNFANLQSEAYQDGARISTNSWGADVFGAYISESQAYDALVRDAQPDGSTFPTAGNQEMVIIFSAGNAGPGGNSIGSPGTGKNVLTVGASEGVQPIGGTDASGVDDTGADNYNDIIFFSARGPTDDGRQKPDLVAPGTHVTGGVWQAAAPGANGTADPGFVGGGVSGGPGGVNFFPLGQEWYSASSGTSHSAPGVAGGAALVRQYFINQGLPPASPAMTKAFLVSAARYLTGVDANDTLPSPNQGMGMMDLGRAFTAPARILRDQRALDTFTASGQTRTISGVISDPAQPLRVTLAWTDAPGPTSGSAFLNDLNLSVTIGGQTYLGNVFSGATSVTGGTADVRNNVESVFLPAGFPAGTPFSIKVTAANIVADGVPNSGPALDQDFALSVLNGTEVPTPSIEVVGVALTGENFQPANGFADPGETISVTLTLRNVGTAASVNTSAALEATGGVTNPSAAQSYGSLPPDGSNATRTFRLRVDPTIACGGTLTMSFQVQDGATNVGTVPFTLPVGTFVPSGSVAGSNNTAMTLPDGPASLYPSEITIAGATGRVLTATVTLSGLSHSFPADLDVVLAGPGGQRIFLMSDAGGGTDVTGIDLTFNDAASPIPNNTALTSGSYAPANYAGTGDSMPPPAPPGPYGAALSAFAGTDPNGTWSLYINDDAGIDSGDLAGGWSIAINLEVPSCAPAGISATPASLVTSESGGQATFEVVLNRAPTANVTIDVSSSNPTEGTVSPTTLTFTPANWYIPQTVTITGVFDGVTDGDTAYTIILGAAVSADPSYNGFDPDDISVVNRDGYTVALPIVIR